MNLNPCRAKPVSLRPHQRSEFLSFAILAAASISISAASFFAVSWPV